MGFRELMALDKLARFGQFVKGNGGVIGSIKKLYRMDVLKTGTLVGTDKLGNKYYENNMFFHGTNRWVEYSDQFYLDYDGSQISPEWHAWMHYMTDIPPTKANYPTHRWQIDHIPNMTGTNKQYVPYSTVKPKIQAWKPGQ